MSELRRPRETLADLSYNQQPASAMKRSNSSSGLAQPQFSASHGRSLSTSRQSLAAPRYHQPALKRSSSGGNLAGLAADNAPLGSAMKARNSAVMNGPGASAAGRKSFLPGSVGVAAMGGPASTQNAAQRRSSAFQRPSGGRPSFFAQGPVPAGVPRDPRPLKDRAYHNKIGQELFDFLTQGGFEMEMKHALTQNTMKSPTQKDFNYMFQWLYHRIDPSYKFLKNIDQEVPAILKTLRYPYERNLTKSQIAAVGGQNWSTFLGMLHWMMQLIIMLECYDGGNYDNACADAGVDVSGDRIIFKFLTNAYHDWLQVEEDDDAEADKALAVHIEAMAAEIDKSNERYMEEEKMLKAENNALRAQIAEVEKAGPNAAKLDEDYRTLETDIAKFDFYMSQVGKKIEKYNSRVGILQEAIVKIEEELRDAETERSTLQESVDKQGITIQDIDRMSSERDRLQKASEAMAQRLEGANRALTAAENEASRKLEELERSVQLYNKLGWSVQLIPATAQNAKGREFALQLTINEGFNYSTMLNSSQNGRQRNENGVNDDRLLADASAVMGYQPHHLLGLDLRGSVRTRLAEMKAEISERRAAAQEAELRNADALDALKEQIDEKKVRVEELEHKLRAAEEECERTKEITSTARTMSTAQIERLESDLSSLRTDLSTSIQSLEQREVTTNLQYEQLKLKSDELREELHSQVERCLNDVIRFKLHVQKSLNELESWIVKEVEEELEGGTEDADEMES